MADDEGLTRCLAEHSKARGVPVLGSDPVLHPEKKRGIVDLMFGKQRRPHGEANVEHLVVELKAPKVKIRQKELTQVENYAQAVVADSRFDKTTTRWSSGRFHGSWTKPTSTFGRSRTRRKVLLLTAATSPSAVGLGLHFSKKTTHA